MFPISAHVYTFLSVLPSFSWFFLFGWLVCCHWFWLFAFVCLCVLFGVFGCFFLFLSVFCLFVYFLVLFFVLFCFIFDCFISLLLRAGQQSSWSAHHCVTACHCCLFHWCFHSQSSISVCPSLWGEGQQLSQLSGTISSPQAHTLQSLQFI